MTGCPVSTTIARTAPSVRKKLRFQPPRALALAVHRRNQHLRQAGQRRRYHAFGGDRFGKPLLHDVIRQRLARADRRIALPQRLFQQGGEASAEPGRYFVAGAGGDIADGFQPGAAQAAGDGLVSAEREHRQQRDRIGFPTVTDDFPGDATRHRARADRCARNRAADDKALPCQRAAHHLHQRGLAAEQMGAAGDVEKQAMRGIERHQRRETIAPIGNLVQHLDVGRFIGVEYR